MKLIMISRSKSFKGFSILEMFLSCRGGGTFLFLLEKIVSDISEVKNDKDFLNSIFATLERLVEYVNNKKGIGIRR